MKNWKQVILGLVLLTGVLFSGSPVFAGGGPTINAIAAVSTDKTVSWSWTSASGSFRYSLDSESDWVETTATSFTPSSALTKGNHTLYVQEDLAGSWSVSGSASLYCLETDGTGTVQIGDAADLTAFSTFVNAVAIMINPANSLTNASLTDDITLTTNAGNPWQPIGKTTFYRYQGVFDGQNHVIRGLYLAPGNSYTGLFGVSSGTIKNLSIADSTISSTAYVGAFVGMANGGSQIINCHNTAPVSGDSYVGGIAGSFLGTLQNCSNTGAVTGATGNIGGIVGWQQGIIANCYNSGAVTSTSAGMYDNIAIGGISGKLFSETTSRCYNSGIISVASHSATCYHGGIIGETFLPENVSNCYYMDTTAKGIGNNSADNASQTARENFMYFPSGEVCYKLQAGQATQIWGQTLTGSTDPQPVLSTLAEKKVFRVILDYSDATPDQCHYHNQNDSISIPQSADYAVTLDGASFTASSYKVGTSDATFTVTKRQAIIGVLVAPYGSSFDGSDHPAVTVIGQPADAQVTYSTTGVAGSFTDTQPEINEVGSVDVYVKVSGFYYYDYLSDKMTATVSQASAPTVGPVEKSYPYTINDSDETIDVAALLPANRGASSYSLGTVSDPAAIIAGTPTIGTDGILDYDVKSGAIGDTATIPVLITSKNYTQITVNVKITLTDKQVLTISGAALTNKAYDGSPIALSTAPLVKNTSGTDVAVGTLSYLYTNTDGVTYSSSTAPTSAGAYQLVISVPSDNPDYRGGSVPIPFRITPRAITITAINQSITVGTERPADAIVPPNLVTGETISGVSFNCDYIKNDAVKGGVGSYLITPVGGSISSGNANYAITYGPGTLTVSPVSSGGGGYTPPVMPGIAVIPGTITFDPSGNLAVDITGAPAGSVVYYSLDGITFITSPPAMENAGEHKVFVKITCPGYQDYTTQTTVMVEKHEAPVIPELSLPVTGGQQSGSTDLGTLLPTNRGETHFRLGPFSDPSGILSGPPTIDQLGHLTYGFLNPLSASGEQVTAAAETTALTATITVLVSMENYADTTINVVIGDSPAAAIGVQYQTHVQDYGWENDWITDGNLSGTFGQSKRLEALKVELTGDVPAGATIDTEVHVQNQGNLGPFAMGTEAGTTGLGLRLENIGLTLKNLPGYTILYNVHVQNQGWLRDENDSNTWFKSGETAGTSALSLRLEGIRIKLVKSE